MNTATFGAGCFWGVEKAFRRKYGPFIHSILVGYTGGHTENVNYRQVCSGKTGHAEVVQLVYDASKVSYADLVDFFYRMHEPHTLNRQGNDIGSQYRSAIFYHDEEQKKIAESVTETAQKYYGKVKISTTIEPIGIFYKAEDYHQDYLTSNPHGYECATHFGILKSLNIREALGEDSVVLSINMSDHLMESDISRLKDVLSKVVSTEKALNEFTSLADFGGTQVAQNLVKLRELISEAKDTLNNATARYHNLEAQSLSFSGKEYHYQPPLRPYVQKASERISKFGKRFKIVGSIFYADIVILYTLTVLWNWLIPLPRLEWLIFTGLSLISFLRAFCHSRAIFSNSLVIVVAAALQISYLQQQFYGRLWGDIDVITIIGSIMIHQISLQDLRGEDPNAQFYWITFVISDILFKSNSKSSFHSFICCFSLVYSFMMIWVRAHAYSIEKKADNEAAGVPGYGIEGKLQKSWSWNGSEPETFYSNHFQREDRFELTIKKIMNSAVLFSYSIPRSLATSLCTARDYKKLYQTKPKNSYNITALLDDFPDHYVLRRDIMVFVNNQNWDKFKINVNIGTILISGLEEGKSYKISVEIEGFKSLACRIRTSAFGGKWDHLKYINAEICRKSLESNSRPVSSLSFTDYNNDISFSVDERATSEVSFFNSELPASSQTGSFSEIELNDHLSKMIRREKESLKAVENTIFKAKSDMMKEFNSLHKTLDGILKISSKAEGQNEKYKSKISLYEDMIQESKIALPKLRNQISALRSENTKLEDVDSKLTKEIDNLNSKIKHLKISIQTVTQNHKIQVDSLVFGNEELKKVIDMHRSNLSSIFLATQKLSDPSYPTGIHAMSAQLEVYEARYQRQLEMNATSRKSPIIYHV